MKVIATKEPDYGFILEASDREVYLLAKIERVLEGETTEEAEGRRPSRGDMKLPNHEKMEKLLYLFLKSVRAHNDYAKSFAGLKELLEV